MRTVKNGRFFHIALGSALALLLAASALLLARHAAHGRRCKALVQKAEAVWTREAEEDCRLVLTLRDGEMEYRFVSLNYPSLSETLYTYSYSAADGDTLRVVYPDGAALDVTVSFSEDGSEMTFVPAVTAAEEAETWIREA